MSLGDLISISLQFHHCEPSYLMTCGPTGPNSQQRASCRNTASDFPSCFLSPDRADAGICVRTKMPVPKCNGHLFLKSPNLSTQQRLKTCTGKKNILKKKKRLFPALFSRKVRISEAHLNFSHTTQNQPRIMQGIKISVPRIPQSLREAALVILRAI